MGWSRGIMFWIVLLLCCKHSCGMNVLLVPIFSTSHILEFLALGEGLISKGHQVTMVMGNTFPKMNFLHEAKVNVVTFDATPQSIHFYDERYGETSVDNIFTGDSSAMSDQLQLTSVIPLGDCHCMMEDQKFMEQLKSQRYDIAVADGFAIGYCNFLLPYTLNIPYAFAYSGMDFPLSYRSPSLPSFTPGQGFAFGPHMTFFQRLQTFIGEISFEMNNALDGMNNVTLLKTYAPEVDSWFDLMRKSVLFLLFKDYNLEYPAASMPNMIRTPGITIRPGKPLPSDLEAVIQKSKGYVALVSFGSYTGTLPRNVILKQFEAFGQFPEVLFIVKTSKSRFENLDIPVPDNVIIKYWLPTQDILAHPKTRLFITHGGNNGQWESVYHEVPMICFPLWADQPHNCERAAAKNISITLDVHTFSTEDLRKAIEEIRSNKLFTEQSKFISKMIRSSPMTPRDTAVYWLEHVNQFGGDHLRSVAMDMSLYQFLMLDIIGALFLMFALLCIIGLFLTKFVMNQCLKRIM